MEPTLRLIGWDWVCTSHAVTVLNATGTIMGCWTVDHTEHDLETLLARPAAYDDPAALPVAIERAEGLVVDRLIAAGHPVVPIDPGAFHAARPRWAPPAPSPIPATATSWPTTSAPKATGSAAWNHSAPRPPSCKPSCACATTT